MSKFLLSLWKFQQFARFNSNVEVSWGQNEACFRKKWHTNKRI